MSVAGAPTVHLATRLIVNQAVSDFADLLNDADRMSGRSAMRAARAVVEHAINLRTVIDDKPRADRYTDHLSQAALIQDAEKFGADGLPGGYGKSVRFRLRKAARDAGPKFEAALKRHGTAFKRSWSAGNLHDRAMAQGQSHLYEFYRFASLTTHGSAASMANARRPNEYGFVNRIGIDPGMTPTALYGGVHALADVVTTLKDAGIRADHAAAAQALQDLAGFWAHLHYVISNFETAFFERTTRPDSPTIVAVARSRQIRWYLHDDQQKVLQPANEPPLSSLERAVVEGLASWVAASAAEFQDPSVNWVGVRLPGTQSPTPQLTRTTIPETAIPLLSDDEFEAFALSFQHENRSLIAQLSDLDRPIVGAVPNWTDVTPPWAGPISDRE